MTRACRRDCRSHSDVTVALRLPGWQAATGSHGRGRAPQGLIYRAALAVGPARVTPRRHVATVLELGTAAPPPGRPTGTPGPRAGPQCQSRCASESSSEPRPGPSPLWPRHSGRTGGGATDWRPSGGPGCQLRVTYAGRLRAAGGTGRRLQPRRVRGWKEHRPAWQGPGGLTQ